MYAGRTARSHRTSGAAGPVPDPVDALGELVGRGDGGSRATELPAEGRVRGGVRRTGAVVPGRDQGVQLATEDSESLVGGDLGLRPRFRTTPQAGAVGLPLLQQVTHLVGLEQAGDAEEVHLLLRADVHLSRVAELAAVVQHPVERRLRPERL